MTPAARLQAAIDILDAVIAAARDNGPAADMQVASWFKSRRFAGSKDRRAVRDLVYRAIRSLGERPSSGRAAMVELARADPALQLLFDGSTYGPQPITPSEPGAVLCAIPKWIEPELYPFITSEEQAALLARASLDLRVNALKGSREDGHAAVPEALPIAGTRMGLRLAEFPALDKNPAYLSGLVEVQDAGSQYISAVCAAAPGMTVVDLCAGAGGKTLALAADMQGKGRLIACDAVRARLAQMAPRAQRAGASFIEPLLLDVGAERRALAELSAQADVVLVDAPCSGTGTWRRNPETRWRLTPDRLSAIARTQAQLLDIAGELVKPGGALIYAVCSILYCEGQGQVERFLAENTGWCVQPLPDSFGRAAGPGRVLTPLHDATDGFFVARLAKGC